MGLTMSQRQAVTKTIAARYKRAGRVEKGTVLDELCATTGWHRNHARKATRARAAAEGRTAAPAAGSQIWAGRRGWTAILLGGAGAPTGKRLAPVMGEL